MALTWIGKSNSKCYSDSEVSVTVNKNGVNKQQTAFRFRNNSALRITKTGFVEYALTNDRVYFRESTKATGYSLTSKTNYDKNCGFKTVHLNDNLIGDYDLLFDKEEKLNYIDLTKKKA